MIWMKQNSKNISFVELVSTGMQIVMGSEVNIPLF